MQKYIPSEAINNIIISLTHANIYGNSIIDTLNTQMSTVGPNIIKQFLSTYVTQMETSLLQLKALLQ
jgi:hypothetical protein